MNLLRKLRIIPFFRCRGFRFVLTALFPPVICLLAELGQSQDIVALWQFSLSRTGVTLFSWIITAAVFRIFSLLTRRAWTGGALTALLYMIVSTVDYYKNLSSGSHLLVTDIQMLDSMSGVGDFASLTFSPGLLGCWLGAAAMVFLLWCADIRFIRRPGRRWLSVGAIAWLTALIVCVPELFQPVCRIFGIDSTYTYNAFGEAERFANNNLISNLVVSISQQADSAVEQPESYSDDLIEGLIDERDKAESLPPVPSSKPNIIVIMSESFADMRVLDDDPALDGIYAAFDRVLADSRTSPGRAVMPTFGGGTVKTEFELLFGLPVRSLNDAFIPHSLLDGEENAFTFPGLYADIGYSTAYIHPYYAEFYGRADTYSRYGFDRLLFLEDMTVPLGHNGYTDDDAVYRQAEALMAETTGPDYIHITTMQNHMPYGGAEEGDEYSCYLDGIRKTCLSLEAFLDRLEKSGEETVVLFTGDHFPYFTEKGNIYKQAGITGKNCRILYEQSCFIWSSGSSIADVLPKGEISSFYLPHLLFRAAGLPEEAFISTMLESMERTPVYSMAAEIARNDRLLDTLTYDRVLGEGYSNDEAKRRNVSERPD